MKTRRTQAVEICEVLITFVRRFESNPKSFFDQGFVLTTNSQLQAMSEPTSKRARTDAPAAVDNPYLAHLNEPHKRMTGGSSGNGTTPFDGWIPRKITGKQVENVMVSPTTPLGSVKRGRENKVNNRLHSHSPLELR